MGNFIKASKKSEIPEGHGKSITLEGHALGIFNIGGNVCAIDNTCKHRGGPLGDGELNGSTVTCPWHGWQYDVTSGACATNPGVSQKKYNIKLEEDDIFVEI